MLFHRKIRVLPHERVLVFREGALDAILKPGVHKLFDPLRKLTLEKVNLREVYFKHDDLDTLSDALKYVQETEDAEAGLITRREETAAARMQANTAKVLDNPRQRSALPSEHRGRDPDAHEAARARGAGEDRGQGEPHGAAR